MVVKFQLKLYVLKKLENSCQSCLQKKETLVQIAYIVYGALCIKSTAFLSNILTSVSDYISSSYFKALVRKGGMTPSDIL